MKKATKSYQNEPVGPIKSSTMKKATKSFQNDPVQSSPVQSSPVQSSLVQSSPVQSSPVQSSPVQTMKLELKVSYDEIETKSNISNRNEKQAMKSVRKAHYEIGTKNKL